MHNDLKIFRYCWCNAYPLITHTRSTCGGAARSLQQKEGVLKVRVVPAREHVCGVERKQRRPLARVTEGTRIEIASGIVSVGIARATRRVGMAGALGGATAAVV